MDILVEDNIPSFHLEGVIHDKDDLKDFEGPLSLILMLLSKNKIEIRDIKISEILDQYTAYLNEMQRLDLDIASEFVRMAAYLLYIKTKMLLTEDKEDVSELELLIESLEQLKAKDSLEKVKKVTPSLQEAYKQGALYYSKPAQALPNEAKEYQYTHYPIELLRAIARVFTSPEKVTDVEKLNAAIPKQQVFSIKVKSQQILNRLRLRDINLNELYSECSSRSEIVATFISVLELCSMGSIYISAASSGKGYELSFSGGDIEDIIDNIKE